MRILLSALQGTPDYALPAYSFWRDYFVNGLNEAGHEVFDVSDVDWVAGLASNDDALPAWKADAWQRTLSSISDHRVDLFLSYLYPRQIDETAIREIRRRGVPCVNFFCDNVREFRAVPSAFKPFDLHWVPEWEALPMYRAAGLPFINAPMPCWVPPALRTPPAHERDTAVFIGSADATRRRLIGEAVSLGANLIVHGRGWDAPETAPGRKAASSVVANQLTLIRQHGLSALAVKIVDRIAPLENAALPRELIGEPLCSTDYARETREAVVAIGINRVKTPWTPARRPALYSRLRDIEAPMLGACYLTEKTRGLADLYELGVEIETYVTVEELTEKLAALRADSARRTELRRRGQRRALAEHTIARSITRIAERLGLPRNHAAA